MLDELDDGARIGVWTALGVVALLLFGLLGGLAIKAVQPKTRPVVVAAAPAGVVTAPVAAAAGVAAPAVQAADAVLDVPLAGDLVGMVYFAVGQAALPADAASTVATVKTVLDAAGGKKLVLSGFHDATGDPAKNAELAKERAKAVREALEAAGVAADCVALRKPESTTGDGTNQEARRVEIRLVP
jgi:outer membrane protein OmpA-like peptidoglycan-associated protein